MTPPKLVSEPSFEQTLQTCNKTELIQICRLQGLRPDWTTDRQEIINSLLDQTNLKPSQVDPYRYALTGFILDNWVQLRAQLTCPAKDGDVKACFQCEDAKVASCLINNKELLPLIRRHLLSEETMGEIETATIDNVNLNEEELRGMGVVLHQLLGTQLGEAGFPVWENTPQKTSFTVMPPGERAKILVERIKEYRAGKGESPKAPVKQRGRPKKVKEEEPEEPPTTSQAASFSISKQEFEQLKAAVQQAQENTDKMLSAFQAMLGMLAVFGQNILGLNTPQVVQVGLQEGLEAVQAINNATGVPEGEDNE